MGKTYIFKQGEASIMSLCDFSGCDCAVDNILNTFEYHHHKITLCPNHMLLYLLGTYETIKFHYSDFEHGKCEICGNEAIKFNDGKYTMYLCPEHFRSLHLLCLDAPSFFKLRKGRENMFLLHDDFYDQITGKALQPITE